MDTIPATIKEQIGNQAFVMMGTCTFSYTRNSLSFNLQGSEVTLIKIYLNAMDLYDVTFYTAAEQRTIDNLYFDQLHEIIERETGLFLSLG